MPKRWMVNAKTMDSAPHWTPKRWMVDPIGGPYCRKRLPLEEGWFGHDPGAKSLTLSVSLSFSISVSLCLSPGRQGGGHGQRETERETERGTDREEGTESESGGQRVGGDADRKR